MHSLFCNIFELIFFLLIEKQIIRFENGAGNAQ